MSSILAVPATGGTGRLVDRVGRARGHHVRTFDVEDPAATATALRDTTAIVLIPQHGDTQRSVTRAAGRPPAVPGLGRHLVRTPYSADQSDHPADADGALGGPRAREETSD